MSNSSSIQDSNFSIVWQCGTNNKNLLYDFEKTDHQPNLNFEAIYDLNNKMIVQEDLYFNSRVHDFLSIKQKFLNPQMRTILLNWILEVTAQLGFKRETYHLTVFLIDTFLQNNENLATNNFQLLGVSCLMISSKFNAFIRFLWPQTLPIKCPIYGSCLIAIYARSYSCLPHHLFL